MNTIRAGTLLLEPQLKSHAAEMFAVLSDPAIYEFENEAPSSEEALWQRYAKLESRRSADGTEQWLNWVIKLPTGALAGFMQATVLVGGRAYVAYEIGSPFWRQGVASTALRAVLRELGERYYVRDAFAVLKATNYRSLGLLSKVGFGPIPPAARPPWAAEAGEVVVHKAIGNAENAV